MSQYYPQPGPFYPPEQNPEDDDDYYYEDDFEYEYEDDEPESSANFFTRYALTCFTGGCLVFLCLACCGLFISGLWLFGDSLIAATPIPGSDIGLSFGDPAFPGDEVVNEQGVKLIVLDVNRDAALATIPAVEGRELIIITIELVNLGEAEVNFNETDFLLLNRFEEAYTPTPSTTVADINPLGRGVLPPGEGLEARLVFEVIADEFELVLTWDGGPESEPRYISLR